jgi:MYXO-CTERM domain-containing protein
MRRHIVIALVVALPLAVATPAAAKEPVRAKVCGASDCVEVKDRSLLLAMVEGGPPGPPPRSGAPWYRATMVIATGGGHTDSFPLAVVPRSGYVRSRPDGAFAWMRMPASGRTAWRRVTRGLEPRPATDLRGLDAPAPGAAAPARVDEVVEPPADPTSSASSDSPAWPWIVSAAAGLGLLGMIAVWLRRRRRGGGTMTPPGPAPEAP